MKARDFCYWLQGYFEIAKARNGRTESLKLEEVKLIQKHLAMVFKHEIDPSFGDDNEALNKIHGQESGKKPVMRC